MQVGQLLRAATWSARPPAPRVSRGREKLTFWSRLVAMRDMRAAAGRSSRSSGVSREQRTPASVARSGVGVDLAERARASCPVMAVTPVTSKSTLFEARAKAGGEERKRLFELRHHTRHPGKDERIYCSPSGYRSQRKSLPHASLQRCRRSRRRHHRSAVSRNFDSPERSRMRFRTAKSSSRTGSRSMATRR